MTSITKYFGNLICKWLTGTDMPTAPVATYVALFNGDPQDAGVEVTTTVAPGGRIETHFNLVTDDDTLLLTSAAEADFGNADGGATFDYIVMCDAQSGGHVLAVHLLDAPMTVILGQEVSFPSGNITFEIGSVTAS